MALHSVTEPRRLREIERREHEQQLREVQLFRDARRREKTMGDDPIAAFGDCRAFMDRGSRRTSGRRAR